MNNKKFLQKALRVAIDAARSSGEILMQKYKKIDFIRHKKSDIQEFVTDADLASEKRIKKVISAVFPKHSILAEESGLKDQKSDYLWVIDPLCGTANFINQIDFFVVSIALLCEKNPVLAVVYDPVRGDLYRGTLNQGAYFNREKTHISEVKSLRRAAIAFNLGKTKAIRQKWLPIIGRLIVSCYKMREYGTGPLSGAFLSTGRIDGYIHPAPYLWDAITTVILTREAGGKVTDWQGKEWNSDSGSFVASNGKIHQQLIKILNE